MISIKKNSLLHSSYAVTAANNNFTFTLCLHFLLQLTFRDAQDA